MSTLLETLVVVIDLREEGRTAFLTYETEFILFLAVLENSVLSMG